MKGLKSAMDAAFKAQNGGPPIDVRPTAKGDAGVIEGLAKQLWAQALADQQSCAAQLADTGFPGFMAPERLAAGGGVRRAQAALSKVSAIVQACRVLQEGRLNAYRESIRHSHLDDAVKRAVLENIKQGYNDAYEEMDSLWELDAEIVGEYQQAVAVLARSQGRWVAYRHQIRFYDAAAMEDFNSHILRAKSLAAEEASRRAADRDKWRQTMSTAIEQNVQVQ